MSLFLYIIHVCIVYFLLSWKCKKETMLSKKPLCTVCTLYRSVVANISSISSEAFRHTSGTFHSGDIYITSHTDPCTNRTYTHDIVERCQWFGPMEKLDTCLAQGSAHEVKLHLSSPHSVREQPERWEYFLLGVNLPVHSLLVCLNSHSKYGGVYTKSKCT